MKVEFGQTHVLTLDESGLVPHLVPERDTIFLFTPDSDDSLRLEAELLMNGKSVHRQAMASPAKLPAHLEQDYTSVPLGPYSDRAWSLKIPWFWFDRGLKIVVHSVEADGTTAEMHEVELPHERFGAPSDFTVARLIVGLFGQLTSNDLISDATTLARDYFPLIPVSQLTLVDYHAHFTQVVVPTDDGPITVAPTDAGPVTVADVEQLKRKAYHGKNLSSYEVLKRSFTIRVSLANSGLGLTWTDFNVPGGSSKTPAGDKSPYAYNTVVGFGWYKTPASEGEAGEFGPRDELGNVSHDMVGDDNPGGFWGWSAIGASEVGQTGNLFLHEVGHSQNLKHFRESDVEARNDPEEMAEYPNGGLYRPDLAQAFDTLRQRFRTWYLVTEGGPHTSASGALVAKRDPMNGGCTPSRANEDVVCLPQFTPASARTIQAWFESQPAIREHPPSADRTPTDAGSVVRWQRAARAYEPAPPVAGGLRPEKVGVPVVTILGTIGHASTPSASYIYEPIFAAHGNVFEWPDPFEREQPDPSFNGASYWLRVTYLDRSTASRRGSYFALINRPRLAGPIDFATFSINLDASRHPVKVELFRSVTEEYPDLKPFKHTSECLATREIPELPKWRRPPAAVRVGRQYDVNSDLLLREMRGGYPSSQAMIAKEYDLGVAAVYFTVPGQDPAMSSVSTETSGRYTSLEVDVVAGPGMPPGKLRLRAQRGSRGIGSTDQQRTVVNDPRLGPASGPDALFVWAELADNPHLRGGAATNAHLQTIRGRELIIEARKWAPGIEGEGPVLETIPISIALTVPSSRPTPP